MALELTHEGKHAYFRTYRFTDGNYTVSMQLDEDDPVWHRENLTQSIITVYASPAYRRRITVSCRVMDLRYSDPAYDPVIYEQIGLSGLMKTPYAYIDENSPEEYREAKAVINDIEEMISEHFPGYGILSRNTDKEVPAIGKEIERDLFSISDDLLTQTDKAMQYGVEGEHVCDRAGYDSLRKELIEASGDESFWMYYDRACQTKENMLKKYAEEDIFAGGTEEAQ